MLRLIFLICNLFVIASYPAYASPLSEFAKAHNIEFIAAGCLVMGIIGSIGGMLYPLPDDSKIKDWRLKLVASIMAGIAAFVYAIGTPESLRPIVILWCGGVALVAPALIDNIHAMILAFIMKKFGGA